MTLLDQILAMILGKLPRLADTSLKQHFEMIQSEHSYIANEWKIYFGRLPPISSTLSNNQEENNEKDNMASQPKIRNETINDTLDSKCKKEDFDVKNDPISMRSALGINENAGDEDWDELDWETMILPSNEQNNVKNEKTNTHNDDDDSKPMNDDKKQQTTKPQRIGLRPGGRIS